jgi:hypothetical protein
LNKGEWISLGKPIGSSDAHSNTKNNKKKIEEAVSAGSFFVWSEFKILVYFIVFTLKS